MKPFFKVLLIETLIIAIIGFFPFLSWGTPYKIELISAFSLSLVNAIVGYTLVIKNYSEDNNIFLKNVYGGMILRMVFVLGFSFYMTMNG